jgi:hypothetical protein
VGTSIENSGMGIERVEGIMERGKETKTQAYTGSQRIRMRIEPGSQ